MTRPKQWNRGGGQQMMSSLVKFNVSPVKVALLMRFLFGAVSLAAMYNYVAIRKVLVRANLLIRVKMQCVTCDGSDVRWESYTCESMAAFGEPVVPVYVSSRW